MSSIAFPTTLHTSNVDALPQEEIKDQAIASYGTMEMIIPKSSFGHQAVVIKQESSADQTIEGLIQEARNVYAATRELLFVWKKNEITDYLQYREDSPNYAVQITPFPRTNSAPLQQLTFLANVTFGVKYSQDPLVVEKFRENYNQLKEAGEFENIESFLKEAPELGLSDFNLEKMEQQKLIEGVFTKVFIHDNPTEPIHLLIIPNRADAKRFSDLTPSEFIEVHLLSEKIREIYKKINRNAPISIFSKTGQQAGQEVGRNHFHISVGETQSKFYLALSYLKKIFLPLAPLTTEGIHTQVTLRKAELSELSSFIQEYKPFLEEDARTLECASANFKADREAVCLKI